MEQILLGFGFFNKGFLAWCRFCFWSLIRPVGLLGLVICSFGEPDKLLAQGDPAGFAFFENRIRPIFAEHCYQCHSGMAKKIRGGLKLDTREDFLKGGIDGPILASGLPEKSRLIRAVSHLDKELRMPPPEEGLKKLPENKIADLVAWVKMGAPYPETPVTSKGGSDLPWSLGPVKNPSIPLVRDRAWLQSSIDPFILSKLEKAGIKPAARADHNTLIRRATFDLTGLPPKPEEVLQFESDKRPGAFERVVDRLLASPQYGEHWGRHWLDVVRYADTAGDTADYPLPEAWRYRNYVMDSFNGDKPYDVFLREQVAGDILASQGPPEKYAERVAATGFLALSRRFGFDSENYQHLTIQDTIDTLGQSVLALTVGCARCHDHKFDPISTKDYYGLYGIFDSTRYAFPGSEQKGKFRALVPLVPMQESKLRFRDFQSSFATLGIKPASILRSIDDMDGDFEMQRAASGGSNGVLVSPWFYDGKVSVAQSAQSPFKNLHPFGEVGCSIAPDIGDYSVSQRIYPTRTKGIVHFNLDFKVANGTPAAKGGHRLMIGSKEKGPLIEIFLYPREIVVRMGPDKKAIPLAKPGDWHNLRLDIDLDKKTFSGLVGLPGQVTPIEKHTFAKDAMGPINLLVIESKLGDKGALPGLDFDNIALQETPISPVSLTPTAKGVEWISQLEKCRAELKALGGFDGDLESQTAGTAPSLPYHPGPNSGVIIKKDSQSPNKNIYPVGKQGIHMPMTAAGGYNGFGLHLPQPFQAATTERLYLGFDFRVQSGKETGKGALGTWRFQLGKSHISPAIEMAFNEGALFVRSGKTIAKTCSLTPGEWYQIVIKLDLKNRKYVGSVASGTQKTEIHGLLAEGWEGTIDYAFIDSGGHLAGAKPAMDADNFLISTTNPVGPGSLQNSPELLAMRQQKIQGLKERIATLSQREDKAKKELEAQLVHGPVDLAYGVSEATPHNVKIQIRGEPDRPGAEVPRGFIRALGGKNLGTQTSGSGRLELAQWLTNPDNPLTARVMVNRIWQYHFGRGLVLTPNDFGTRSVPPTHPELLDHLATQFVQNGWSIKSMHRLILLSSTWQQSTHGNSKGAGDLYGAFAPRRLSAEEIRDSILFVSGTLDLMPGKEHPFPNATTWGFSQHAPFQAVYDHDKRSTYLMVQRLKRHPFLALFDGPDTNSSTPERRVTTVPTQALYFLNDPFVHAKSQSGAQRVMAVAKEESSQIDYSYKLALGRSPTAIESLEASAFLAAFRAELTRIGHPNPVPLAMAAHMRTLFGSNEFLHCD